MRHLTCLLPLLLLSTACVTEAGDDLAADDEQATGGKSDGAARALVASADPLENRLAAVEGVLGLGLRAITMWERDTETNGRDVWLTLSPYTGPGRTWKTNENILAIGSAQFTTGMTRFIGTESNPRPEGYAVLPFWLDARIEQTPDGVSPTLHLTKQGSGDPYEYTVEAREDELATMLGSIEEMDRSESGDHLARLFELAAPGGRRDLVLVLTDRAAHHVFPLDLRVDGASQLGFADATAIEFETRERQADGEALTKRYQVSWDDVSEPSIQRAP